MAATAAGLYPCRTAAADAESRAGRCAAATAGALMLLLSAAAPAEAAGKARMPWIATLLARAIESNADSGGTVSALGMAKSVADGIGAKLLDLPPEWKQAAEFDWGLAGTDQPWLRGRFVSPLAAAGDGAWLLQGRLAMEPASGTYQGFGVGYRQSLDDDQWLLGSTVFYDRDWTSGNDRLGVGWEAVSSAMVLRANVYQPMSSRLGDGVLEQATGGYDLSLRSQLPYLPWASVSAEHTAWQGSGAEDRSRFGLTLQPLSFLHVSGEIGQSGDAEPSYAVSLRLTVSFSGRRSVLPPPLIDDQPFRFGSVRAAQLSRFERDASLPVSYQVVTP